MRLSQTTGGTSTRGSTDLSRRNALMSAGGLLAASAMAPAQGRLQAASREGDSATAPGEMRRGMLAFMLGHEQFRLPELLSLGAEAEQAGFNLLATSDHFQPWQANEKHSGQAWVTMGALTQKTRHAWIGPTVTCPTFRYNPAVVAEAYASLTYLAPGRIFLGLGSGEALNEQAATGQWPAWRERSDRLVEAVDIIRKLWTGNPVKHQGRHYTVNARLYDPPAKPIPLLLAANGPKAMRLAGQHGDGLITDPQTWKLHHGNLSLLAMSVTPKLRRNCGISYRKLSKATTTFPILPKSRDMHRPSCLWRRSTATGRSAPIRKSTSRRYRSYSTVA
jgi:hypothetical protein